MTFLLLALIPVLIILFYYYNRDRHPEPWRWVALVLVLGALSAPLAIPVERWVYTKILSSTLPKDTWVFWQCVLGAGMVEETIKLLVVLLAVSWRKDFDEPVDGLIYGTAAALGFTFTEDLIYYSQAGAHWTRALSSVAHPWFSCFWAGALGKAKRLPRGLGVALVLAGLVVSMFVHGLYDFFVQAGSVNAKWAWLRHLLVPLMVLLYWGMEQQLEEQDAERDAEE